MGNTSFQLSPRIFDWVEVWRLARPLQDLEMPPTKPLLNCPSSGALSWWTTQPCVTFNALTDGKRFLLKISSHHLFFPHTISRPVPFAEKQLQSMMFPPPHASQWVCFIQVQTSAINTAKTCRTEKLLKKEVTGLWHWWVIAQPGQPWYCSVGFYP